MRTAAIHCHAMRKSAAWSWRSAFTIFGALDWMLPGKICHHAINVLTAKKGIFVTLRWAIGQNGIETNGKRNSKSKLTLTKENEAWNVQPIEVWIVRKTSPKFALCPHAVMHMAWRWRKRLKQYPWNLPSSKIPYGSQKSVKRSNGKKTDLW